MRSLLPLLALLLNGALAPAPRAASPLQPDLTAFQAAARTLRFGFHEKAAADFESFIRLYPRSTLIPQAVLLEARARSDSGQLDLAADLLQRRQTLLGTHRDEGLYLLGEIRLRQRRPAEAAATWRRLLSEFPASSLILDAAFSEALAHFRAGEFLSAAALLDSPTNAFARAAAALPDSDAAIRGRLLLANAHLRAGHVDLAQSLLSQPTPRPLPPPHAWDHLWLQISVLQSNRQSDAALAASSNLLALATSVADPDLLARTHALRADLLRQMERTSEAFAALTNNLAPITPAPWRQAAVLALANLPLNPAQLAPAIDRITPLALTSNSGPDPWAARLTLADLRLRLLGSSSPAPNTNAIPETLQLLQSILAQPPSPALEGRARLLAGWIDLAQDRLPAATESFTRSVALLEGLPLQGLALFKLADCQQRAALPGPALTNYLRVIREFGSRAPVRGAILERALYQGTLAAIDAGQKEIANELALQAVIDFPNGEFRDDTRVLYGQTLARMLPPRSASQIIQQLGAQLTNSPALPEIQLAVAHSYLVERNWSNAVVQLDDWIRSHPNHAGIARAEFERAWATYRTGDSARAFSLFTNFLTRFPDHPSGPQAQMWVGDYLVQTGNLRAAESSYQLVYQRTNWPVTRLTHEARLMAGRAAFLRQNFKDARDYFVWIIENGPPAITNSPIPQDLVARAYFALGDCFLQDTEGTYKLADAMSAFQRVIEQFPDTREAILARGKQAHCHLSGAELDPRTAPSAYTNAARLYLEVIQDPKAEIAARSEAELGLAVVREKQAGRAEAPEKDDRLKEALAHRLNVFSGTNLRPGESASRFWVSRAGLEAAQLAESLGMRQQAAALYRALADSFPASANAFLHRASQLNPTP